MIVYNTTFHVENDILSDFLSHMKKEYIPKAASSGFLHRPCLRRVLHGEENEGESFSVQFHVKNADTLNYWLEQEGQALHQELVRRFGSKMVGFTTLLDEIDWEG